MANKEDQSQVFVQNGSTKVKELTLSQKLKDEGYRKRIFHSCWLSISSFTLGIIFGQQGPTFLDLQIITNTDVESASFFFTAASFGYMTGSFLCGFVHGKVNNNILMCIVNAGAGVAAIITPYCSPYPLMLVIRFTTNMFCGGTDTLVNAEHMRIWGKDGRAVLQAIHFMFAFGGVITPMFTEPFLAAKETGNETSLSYEYMVSNVTVQPQNGTDNLYNISQLVNVTVGQQLPQRTTNVRYAFLIAGIIAIINAIPYIFLACLEKTSKSPAQEKYARKNYIQESSRYLCMCSCL